MMTATKQRNSIQFFDDGYVTEEQIPRSFSVTFKEIISNGISEVQVIYNNQNQVGDVINDNSYKNDFYRYHDIFHYSFATLLGWSPCARAMMKRKRKTNEIIDKVEDGARAAITEEALSMIIFNEAKKKDYFKNKDKVSKVTLRIIKEMTENFEVSARNSDEWQYAILKSYEVFRFLIENKGGTVEFDAYDKQIRYFVI